MIYTLLVSQYIAHKSEPMGFLGDSASFRERVFLLLKTDYDTILI